MDNIDRLYNHYKNKKINSKLIFIEDVDEITDSIIKTLVLFQHIEKIEKENIKEIIKETLTNYIKK